MPKVAMFLTIAGALAGCKGGTFQRQQQAQLKLKASQPSQTTDMCAVDSSLLRTEARLVNTFLHSGALNNALTYEIAVIACDGTHQPIADQLVYFAINAEVKDPVAGQFLAANGSEDLLGTMEIVEGEDFFGARGPELFHYRSDKPVTMTDVSSDTALQFTIKFGGQKFSLAGNRDSGRFTARTFVRVGDALPTVQAVDVLP